MLLFCHPYSIGFHNVSDFVIIINQHLQKRNKIRFHLHIQTICYIMSIYVNKCNRTFHLTNCRDNYRRSCPFTIFQEELVGIYAFLLTHVDK